MRGAGTLSARVAVAMLLAAPIGASADPHEPDTIRTGAAAPSPEAPAATVNPQPAAQSGSPAVVSESPAAAAPVTQSAPVAPGAVGAMPSEKPAEIQDAAKPAVTAPTVAAEQAAAPDPLAALDPADRPVAEKIRDLLATKGDKILSGKRERAAVEAFYQRRNLAPLWLDKGIENARAKAVVARIKQADADGLEAADYKVPTFSGLSADALAEAELRLTDTVLTYARHLQAGRFPYARVSNNIELPQAPPDAADVLGKIAEANDAGQALEAFTPPHAEYKKLKAVLAQMRGKASDGKDIADGPLLKLNPKAPMEDARVPLVRERLRLPGDASDLKYDAKLADAVKKFQRANELPVTGNLDSRTIRELNGPSRDKQMETVILNMERWRWYPRDLGAAHVVVNLPDYTLRVLHNDNQVWSTRVVIGKPNMATPLLSETMKYITINPTWNVPPSIVHNEYLPALAQDPTVLQRMGLRLTYNRDGSVHIYQPPGEQNALGRIRFNFPNRFLVYQHDTPDKQLFGHDTRADSHGCMRVEDPARYAEVLLNIARPSENWTVDRIKRMFGTAEQDLQLPTPIWVHLTYQTAFVDDAGKLQIRRDVYNQDGRLLAAIKSERGMIDPLQERRHEREAVVSATRHALPPRQGAFSFFQALFGGRPVGRPVPPRPIYR